MRPNLPAEKKRKMVSFMISPKATETLEIMFSAYKDKVFRRFTKTDLFEMAILHLSQDLKKTSMKEFYSRYIEGKEENPITEK